MQRHFSPPKSKDAEQLDEMTQIAAKASLKSRKIAREIKQNKQAVRVETYFTTMMTRHSQGSVISHTGEVNEGASRPAVHPHPASRNGDR